MDAGALRTKITVQRYKMLHDKIGNPSGIWEDFRSFYAYVTNLSGREYWEAAAVQAETTMEVITRWKPFFNEIKPREYRLCIRDCVYDIKSVDNLQNRNKTVKIRAVQNA